MAGEEKGGRDGAREEDGRFMKKKREERTKLGAIFCERLVSREVGSFLSQPLHRTEGTQKEQEQLRVHQPPQTKQKSYTKKNRTDGFLKQQGLVIVGYMCSGPACEADVSLLLPFSLPFFLSLC
jgi:hypothetical protein